MIGVGKKVEIGAERESNIRMRLWMVHVTQSFTLNKLIVACNWAIVTESSSFAWRSLRSWWDKMIEHAYGQLVKHIFFKSKHYRRRRKTRCKRRRQRRAATVIDLVKTIIRVKTIICSLTSSSACCVRSCNFCCCKGRNVGWMNKRNDCSVST